MIVLALLARVRIRGELLGVTRLSRVLHDGEERVLLRCVEPRRVANSLSALGNRIRVVDRTHCHLLLPSQGLSGRALVEAVLALLSS